MRTVEILELRELIKSVNSRRLPGLKKCMYFFVLFLCNSDDRFDLFEEGYMTQLTVYSVRGGTLQRQLLANPC